MLTNCGHIRDLLDFISHGGLGVASLLGEPGFDNRVKIDGSSGSAKGESSRFS